MYRFDYDRAVDCFRIHVSGFWTPADVQEFGPALHAKAKEIGRQSPRFDVMIESLDFPVQANDVADMLNGVMAQSIEITQGRVAVVVASQLNKLQVERTLVHPRVRPFLSIAQGQAWLAEGRSSG